MKEEGLKLEDLLGRSKIFEGSQQINNVAIIGAGIMGQGIAQTVSASGIEVTIIEIDKAHVEKATFRFIRIT